MNAKIICFLITSFLYLDNIVIPLQAMPGRIPVGIAYTLYLEMGGVNPHAPLLQSICTAEKNSSPVTIIGESAANHMQYNHIYTMQDNVPLSHIEEVRRCMNEISYGWWVPIDYNNVAAMLVKNGFAVVDQELIMVLDLATCSVNNLRNKFNQKLEEELPKLCNQKIQFEKAITDKELDEWVVASAQGLELDVITHDKFAQFIRNNAGLGSCSFYIGYLDGLAVSTCLMIEQKKLDSGEKIASLHLLSTIPAYRGRKFGTFLSLLGIEEAKKAGYSKMILMCPEKIKSFFSLFGFEMYQGFNVYQDQNPPVTYQDDQDSQDLPTDNNSDSDDNDDSNSLGPTSNVLYIFSNSSCSLF